MFGIVLVHNQRRNPNITQFIRDHLDSSLGRFEERISRLEVHLLDENGGKGGDDKVCTIDIKLGGLGQYHVRAKTGDIRASITRAIHKADGLIAKTIDKHSDKTRVRHQHGGLRNATLEALEHVI